MSLLIFLLLPRTCIQEALCKGPKLQVKPRHPDAGVRALAVNLTVESCRWAQDRQTVRCTCLNNYQHAAVYFRCVSK